MIKRKILYLQALLCLTIVWSISSCSEHQAGQQPVLKHVVSFQFKEDISAERKAQAVRDFLALEDEIPEIKKFEGGEDVSVEGLNKGLTHCFILTFENEAARDVYLPHPAHKRVADKNKPLLSDLLVVDFWGEE